MIDWIVMGFCAVFYGTVFYRMARYGVQPTMEWVWLFTKALIHRVWEGPKVQPQLEGSTKVDCCDLHKTLLT